MNEENNTTDELTLLPLDLTKQTEREKKLGETYDDLYSALAEAKVNEDWGRVSAINQAIKAEDQGLGGSEAWNLAAADQELPAGTPGETLADYPNLEGASRIITGLPIETIGTIKSGIERGPITFLQETFGAGQDGELTLSFDELKNVPDLYQYLQQMDVAAHNKERDEYNTFAKDLEDKYDVDNIRDALVLLDEDELIKYQDLLTAAQEGPDPENPISYKLNMEDRTITLDSDLFPEIAFEPDMKFTKKGDLSLPYLGLYGYNDEGEFVKKHSSIHRPFDRSEEGIGALYDHIPDEIKDAYEDVGRPLHGWQDFSSPETSPDPDLYKNTGAQLAMLPLMYKGAKPIAKGTFKKGKDIYKGLENYFNQSKPVPITKQEPHFSELPWSR
tara:strand:+ start:843 stop:2006 length:1164 start_codon:yes stop_codon:yes gene_type:complete